jgi:hypothetical protein
MESAQRIQNTLEVLTPQLEEGWTCWCIAQALETQQAQQQTNFFLASTQQTCYKAALLALAKLLDKHGEAMGLTYLLNLVENHPRALQRYTNANIQQVLSEQYTQLQSFENLAVQVKQLRDRRLAHFDRKHLNEPQTYLQHGLPDSAQIEKCYQLCFTIFNTYQTYFQLPLLDLEKPRQTLTAEIAKIKASL